ncbi:MAG: hypothetical protein AB1758_25680, partial [Candidatus Eremiobacterota bacterium]
EEAGLPVDTREASVLPPEPKKAPLPSPTSAPVPANLVQDPAPAPACEPGFRPTVLDARVTGTAFEKFLFARRGELDIQRPGFVETVQLPFLHGKGHNCALVGAFALDPQGNPYMILKHGDTRLSRFLRGDPYVLLGFVGGRMDKVGADFPKIALGELPEEVGGVPVEGAFRRLGGGLSPTMPMESTESDAYFCALVVLAQAPTGDGGGSELTGLIGPELVPAREGLDAFRDGRVADAGRARTVYARTFDSMGYIPQLGVYVLDHPELAARFDTLGLGPVQDPRRLARDVELDPALEPPPPQRDDRGAVNGVVFTGRTDVPLDQGALMVDATTQHAVLGDGPAVAVAEPFPNQAALFKHDRAKVAVYARHPEQGPMVYMPACERPLLAFKGLALGGECDTSQENTELVRRDVVDLTLSRQEDPGSQVLRRLARTGRLERLAEPTSASSGQCDLKYHYYSLEVPPPSDWSDFVPLSDAIALCRTPPVQADSQTEGLCLGGLADRLGWIPGLRMTVDQARQLLNLPEPAG